MCAFFNPLSIIPINIKRIIDSSFDEVVTTRAIRCSTPLTITSLICDPDEKSPVNLVKDVIDHCIDENRKSIQDTADTISTDLGKVINGLYNTRDTIRNLEDSLNPQNVLLRTLSNGKHVDDIEIGAHLFTQALGFTHHGLYLGDGSVIHYAHGTSGYISVRIDSFADFADGKSVHMKDVSESPAKYSPTEICSRATRRYSENNYNLICNNCESFVRWCRSGGLFSPI